MIPLLKKELRALVPVLALLLFINATDLFEVFTRRLDEKSWGREHHPEDGSTGAVVYLVLALMTAYSLLPREHDERTIEFLWTLPVSRFRIFLSKTLAGLSILWSAVIFGHVTAFLLQMPNHQSFTGHQFRLDLAVRITFVQCAYCAVILCHGIFLSFFRRIGLVLYGIAAWLVYGLTQAAPEAEILNPLKLLEYEFIGRDYVIPWRLLAIHGVGASASLGLAWLLWDGFAERMAYVFVEWIAKPVGKVLMGCAAAVIIVLAISFLFLLAHAAGEHTPVTYETFYAVSAESAHYRFTYPSNLRERSLALIREADSAFERARALLGAKPFDDPIIVDLTEQSGEHAGITSWKKIRMDVTRDHPADFFVHVLAHETTHAIELAESDRRLQENATHATFFGEGLADWVGFRLVPTTSRRLASRRLAAAACERHKLRFDQLADDSELRLRFDPHLSYSVGETWCEALAQCYGDGAAGNVLRSMARKDAPRGLAALPFWQDSLQAAGYDLEKVVARWQALVKETADRERAFLDSLPRLDGGVQSRDGGDIIIIALLDRPSRPEHGWVARIRDNASAKDTDLKEVRGKEVAPGRIELRVPRSWILGERFQLQLGVSFDEETLPYFEEWQDASVPR